MGKMKEKMIDYMNGDLSEEEYQKLKIPKITGNLRCPECGRTLNADPDGAKYNCPLCKVSWIIIKGNK